MDFGFRDETDQIGQDGNQMESLQQLAALSAAMDEQEKPGEVLTAITDRAPVVMCLLNHAPNDTKTSLPGGLSIQWASDSWRRLLGWDPKSLEGSNLRSLAHPADAVTLARIGLQPVGVNVAVRLRTSSNQYRDCMATWARSVDDNSIFATIMCPA